MFVNGYLIDYECDKREADSIR